MRTDIQLSSPQGVLNPKYITGARNLGVGWSAAAYSLPGPDGLPPVQTVKVPKVTREADKDARRIELLHNERHVYDLLGPHPNIIKCYGLYIDSSEAWASGKPGDATAPEVPANLRAAILLEHANGLGLGNYIDTNEPPTHHGKARIVSAVTEALAFVYSCGIAHQDIKADNVLVCKDIPKLGDFGLGTEFRGLPDEEQRFMFKVDQLGFATVLATIARWDVYYWNYVWWKRWPEEHEYPARVQETVWGDVIWKCLKGEFNDIQELVEAVGMVRAEVESWEEEEIPAWKLL